MGQAQLQRLAGQRDLEAAVLHPHLLHLGGQHPAAAVRAARGARGVGEVLEAAGVQAEVPLLEAVSL